MPKGDLSAHVPVKSGDRSSLLADLASMRDGLREVISSIQKNSLEVAAAAQQVSVASSQVASRSMEQAESASSMALAVETLSTGISGVSENASTTKQIAHEASTRSHTGREAISSTASEMEAIASLVQEATSGIHAMAEKSQQISGIVAVIREIADQTNLLALNAAIETARAGEQGRGFAVVADEVRKLAERTAVATSEIAGMIQQVQDSASGAVDGMASAASQVGRGGSGQWRQRHHGRDLQRSGCRLGFGGRDCRSAAPAARSHQCAVRQCRTDCPHGRRKQRGHPRKRQFGPAPGRTGRLAARYGQPLRGVTRKPLNKTPPVHGAGFLFFIECRESHSADKTRDAPVRPGGLFAALIGRPVTVPQRAARVDLVAHFLLECLDIGKAVFGFAVPQQHAIHMHAE